MGSVLRACPSDFGLLGRSEQRFNFRTDDFHQASTENLSQCGGKLQRSMSVRRVCVFFFGDSDKQISFGPKHDADSLTPAGGSVEPLPDDVGSEADVAVEQLVGQVVNPRGRV